MTDPVEISQSHLAWETKIMAPTEYRLYRPTFTAISTEYLGSLTERNGRTSSDSLYPWYTMRGNDKPNYEQYFNTVTISNWFRVCWI